MRGSLQNLVNPPETRVPSKNSGCAVATALYHWFMTPSHPLPSVHEGAALATGCVLAFLSAAVNACFLVRLGTSVSHLTGDVSRVALDLVRAQAGIQTGVAHLLAATFGFVGGASFAGFWIHHPELGVLRPYGRSVMAIGGCLWISHYLLPSHPIYAVAIASFACGLQNALATHYKGIILRTTHLTGLLTDLGTQIGIRLRGYRLQTRKIVVPLMLAVSFFAGAGAGATLVISGHSAPLLLLASIYLAGGFAWSMWTLFSRQNPLSTKHNHASEG